MSQSRKAPVEGTKADAKWHPSPSRRWVWVAGLFIALVVLGADTARRIEMVRTATEAVVGSRLQPEHDPASPTGYRFGQHRLVVPQIDSYHWLLQAEQELNGGGSRIRTVAYDGEPAGREVHWAGFLRWWGLGVADVYRLVHPGLTPVQSLERVAPWANTALLVVLLVVFTPVLAGRLGPLPAALFSLGCVTVYPFYYFFSAGYFDHHGVAAIANVLLVLFLVCGGVGWVRVEDVERDGGGVDGPLLAWLPTRTSARRWFGASGLAGAVGLWISAAAMVPVLLGAGLGAGIALGVGAGSRPTSGRWRVAPELFRVWGIAGALGSLACYFLEYFPGQMGMRLEVNHPLYALAFFGGGDLLARWGALVDGTNAGADGERNRRRSIVLMGLDALLVCLAPLAILVFGVADFRLRDPFLWHLHASSIVEFQPLITWYRTRSPAQSLGELTLAPLVALPIAAVLWPTAMSGTRRLAWRALLSGVVALATGYAAVFFAAVSRGSLPLAAIGGALVLCIGFALPLWRAGPRLAAPWVGVLLVCLVPATALLTGAFLQLRWLGNACALWVAAFVGLALVLTGSGRAPTGSTAVRAVSLSLAVAVFAIAPAAFLRGPVDRPNGEIVTRDASFWLRRRMGGERVVVLASQELTTSMIWYGGFLGLGTLYWENLRGLRASAEIVSAPTADSTRVLLAKHGITHLAFFAWNPGFEKLEASVNAADGTAARGFLTELDRELVENRLEAVPPWMVVLPYQPVTVAEEPDPILHLVEIVPDQKPEIALARLAQYHEAMQNWEAMQATVARSLAIAPNVPALVMRAKLEHAQGPGAAFATTVGQLRAALAREDALDLGDRLDAALVLALAEDATGVENQLSEVLARADEAKLRRLSPARLALIVEGSRRLGLDQRYPEAVGLAQRLAGSQALVGKS